MKITPLSIFFTFFAVFMIFVILSGIKKETIGLRSALMWVCLMLGIGFFSLFPECLDGVIRFFRMKERMIFILLTAVFVLLALIFNLNAKHERLQRDLAKTIQELALIKYRLDKEKKGQEAS